MIVSNVLTEEKKQQVLTLGRLGWSLRRIERQTGIRRETAAAYLKAAGIALRPPGAWGKRAPPKPANEVTTDSGADTAVEQTAKPANKVTTDSAGSASACEPYREFIEQGLLAGRNAMSIWQELVDHHGFTGAYETVKRFVRKQRGTQTPEARAVIITAPGEEAQVDYGDGPQVRDPKTGNYRRTRLFVLTLGFSRKCIRLLRFHSSSQIWAELHETAFRRLGGTTKYIVLDNLTEGVLSPDIYDPKINPLYRDMLAHYSAVAMPCRVRDPDRKGKVERGVGHAKQTPLKGKRFESLAEAQAYLDHWEERWADTRIHGTTKRQVSIMFAEEKPLLQPLPLEPFRYYQYGDRSVHLDGCVEVEAAYYSAPPGWISRRVRVQWTAFTCGCWTPKPANCCASICARSVAGIAFKRPIAPSAHPSEPCNYWPAPQRKDRTSARSAGSCTSGKASPPFAGFKAFCRSTGSMAWPVSMKPARWHWIWKPTTGASYGGIWNANRPSNSACNKSTRSSGN